MDFAPFDAWLAGFVDGEGSIILSNAGKYPFIYVVITQHERSRHVLEEIQTHYGGSITRQLKGKARSFSGDGPSNVLRLDVRSQTQVTALLTNLLPYLRIKKGKAEAALAAIAEWRARAIEYHPSRHRSPRYSHRDGMWTRDEVAFLLAHYRRGQTKMISEKLGRTEHAVRTRAKLLRQHDQ